MLARALDPLLSLVFPPRCAVCRTLGTDVLCGACAAAIVPVHEPICARCGHSLETYGDCRDCRRCPPAFACARALGAYEGVLRDAIHRFKYRDRPALAEPLGKLLADYARLRARDLHHLQFDAVVPIPMTPARRRVRGYNQAERLARVVARELSLPLQTETLVRIRKSRPQVGLTADARRANVQGTLAVRENVAQQTLLVVDDVSTTGASLHECAVMLQMAGARAVFGLLLASD